MNPLASRVTQRATGTGQMFQELYRGLLAQCSAETWGFLSLSNSPAAQWGASKHFKAPLREVAGCPPDFCARGRAVLVQPTCSTGSWSLFPEFSVLALAHSKTCPRLSRRKSSHGKASFTSSSCPSCSTPHLTCTHVSAIPSCQSSHESWCCSSGTVMWKEACGACRAKTTSSGKPCISSGP